MLKLILPLLISGQIAAQEASSFSTRMAETYLATDKNYDISCHYAFNKKFKLITPVGTTIKGPDYIKRDFKIENGDRTVNMTFTLKEVNKKHQYTVLFDNKFVSANNLIKRKFYIAPINNSAFAAEFETSQIVCGVNFAYAYPYEIDDGLYHFNVHPHKIYDWQSHLKTPVERYLNDSKYQSIILLEAGNYRGNLVKIEDFLNNVDYRLPTSNYPSELEYVPVEIPLIVSPAGHNRYDFKALNEVTITFTGGNHNYCIWNNTREIMESFMKSKSVARLTMYYDTSSIIAQAKGMEGFRFNFPKRDINRSNLLKDLFQNRENTLSYHTSYHGYFKNTFFKEFMGMFKTVKLVYQADGFMKSDIITGTGERELEIVLQYL